MCLIMGRTAELVLGIIGGIFGFLGSIFSMSVGGIVSAFDGGNLIFVLGISAMLFSILGLVGGLITEKKRKLGGTFMVIAAIAGIVSISFFFVLPGILFLIGGVMALFRKEDDNNEK